MLRNIKLTLAYDGTNYCGWQVQNRRKEEPGKNKQSIQAVIEAALKAITGEDVKIYGSGRTDAGVHALGQAANFKTRARIPCSGLRGALNFRLPPDIRCLNAVDVPPDFHARFSAKSKIYRYLIFNSPNVPVLLDSRFNHVVYGLDAELMRSELKLLEGEHDFKSFCAASPGIKDTRRWIKSAGLKISGKGQVFEYFSGAGGKLISIEIEANGFLPYMMRNIAGTLIDVGRGKLRKGSVKSILKAENRAKAGPTASPQGLYLVKVKY